MNRKLLIVAALIIVLVGVAAAVYLRSKGTESIEATNTTPATETAAGTDSTPKEEPKMNFDLSVDADGLSKAVATLTLESGGVMKWRFYSNDAPNTVKRITQLISEGFYNGIVFHRVVPGFVLQAGDPSGTGAGGSGVKLKAEFNKHKHVEGILSMARTSDPNSADSQFFVMIGTHPHLDGQYTVFGKVVEGYEHAKSVKQGDKIKTMTIQ
jgi:cyclophilin family peptidyl-prolyl cis-trans isomerase